MTPYNHRRIRTRRRLWAEVRSFVTSQGWRNISCASGTLSETGAGETFASWRQSASRVASIPRCRASLIEVGQEAARRQHRAGSEQRKTDRQVRQLSSVFEPRTLVHSWRLQCKQLGNDSTVFGQCFSPELVSPQRKRHTADTLRPAKWLLSKVLKYVPAYRPSVESSDCFASSEFTLADETLSSTLARSLDLLNLAYERYLSGYSRPVANRQLPKLFSFIVKPSVPMFVGRVSSMRATTKLKT
jgi:hypothetical protein